MRALIVIKKIGKSFTEFLCRDWTPAEKILVATCCVLYGMIHGFLISPIKKGVSIGCNNGNNIDNCYGDLDDDFMFDDEY